MTLRAQITHLLEWWRHRHPSRALERSIPEFRAASEREKSALRRGDTRGIGRARAEKKAALNAALERSAKLQREFRSTAGLML